MMLQARYEFNNLVCICCSSICTLVQFVFVPVQNILNWYKIFCASPIFNFIVQFVVNLQY